MYFSEVQLHHSHWVVPGLGVNIPKPKPSYRSGMGRLWRRFKLASRRFTATLHSDLRVLQGALAGVYSSEVQCVFTALCMPTAAHTRSPRSSHSISSPLMPPDLKGCNFRRCSSCRCSNVLRTPLFEPPQQPAAIDAITARRGRRAQERSSNDRLRRRRCRGTTPLPLDLPMSVQRSGSASDASAGSGSSSRIAHERAHVPATTRPAAALLRPAAQHSSQRSAAPRAPARERRAIVASARSSRMAARKRFGPLKFAR